MKDETEERLNPRLTLMEEVLLLGLKDKQVHISPSFTLLTTPLLVLESGGDCNSSERGREGGKHDPLFDSLSAIRTSYRRRE